jgi:CheY-like chemotaxis protein
MAAWAVAGGSGRATAAGARGGGPDLALLGPHRPRPGGDQGDSMQPSAAPVRPVLVVDDEAAIRAVLVALLRDEGYAVAQAADGAAALGVVRATPPRLILLDMRMPGMDGWEFARRYWARPPDRPGPRAPLVCVTAAVDAAAWGAQIGAAATVGKPFDLDAVLAVVRRHALPPRAPPPAAAG